jgi:integrase
MTPRKQKDPNLLKLEKDEIITDWLQNKAAKTRTSYLGSMKMYIEMTGLTPKQLVTQGRADAKKRYSSDMKVTKHIGSFITMLRDSGMRDASIKTRLNPIYSFYEYYEIRFRREDLKGDMNPTNDEYPDQKMIRTALKFANPLMKAIILVGASSGLSVIDIANLKLKDFKAGYDHDTGITTLKLVRIKTKFKFITFLSSEATEHIIEYLAYRQRKELESMDEDSRKQLAKQRIKGINQYGLTGKTLMEVLPASSDFLFIKTAISDEYLIKPDEQLRQLKTDNIDYMYDQINIRSGLATPSGERNIFLSHQLRKFCDNQMVEAKINPDYREFFLAHKPPGSQNNYHKFAQKLDALKAEYMKCQPYLTIAAEYDAEKDPNFKKLKEVNAAQVGVIENISVQAKAAKDEVESAKAEIENLKKAQQEAKNEYMSIQADRDFDIKYIEHQKEEMDEMKTRLANMEKFMKFMEMQDAARKKAKSNGIDPDTVQNVWED